MNKIEFEQRAIPIMQRYVPSWSLAYNKRRTQLGLCSFRKKTIFISEYYLQMLSWDDLEHTLYHEIAHALVGIGAGHGPLWKRKCRELGISDNRTHDFKVIPDEIVKQKILKPKYLLVCPHCGYEHFAYKKQRRTSACLACCNKYNGGFYSDKFEFMIKELR